MKPQLFIFLFFLSSVFSVSAQTDEARLVDEFGRIQCGDFMARITAGFVELMNSPESKLYVVYYGGRTRKESIWNKKTKKFDKIKLKYPHHEDGLNWAKSIPLYLTTVFGEKNPSLKDKIILVDGGFRENIETEIWLVPKNAEPPKPTPMLAAKDVKFRTGKPIKTPNFAACYDRY